MILFLWAVLFLTHMHNNAEQQQRREVQFKTEN
jgi:hypothetical protein